MGARGVEDLWRLQEGVFFPRLQAVFGREGVKPHGFMQGVGDPRLEFVVGRRIRMDLVVFFGNSAGVSINAINVDLPVTGDLYIQRMASFTQGLGPEVGA